MAKTLKESAFSGVLWTLLEKTGNQGLQFVVGIILARLLTPAEFGLVGMVTVFIAISSVFVDSGFGVALINKKNTSIVEESSVFWFNLLISVVAFLLLFLVAPVIAGFYEEPILTDITRVLGFLLVIQAFSSIHLNLLTKELDFKTQFKLTLTSKVVSGTIGIIAAFAGYGVWALVIQRIIQTFWQSAGLWIFHKWRPHFIFKIKDLKPLWKFGSNVLFSQLLRTFFDNLYSLVIGKGFSAADLGFYRRAKGYQNLPLSFLTATIGKITFPVFSKVKDDRVKYIHYMRKSLILMSFFSFPMMAGLAVMAKPLIVIMITEKWLPAVIYLQLLCISGMLNPWHLMNVQSIIAFGRSDLNLKITIIKNSLRLINLLIMMNFSVLHIVIGEVAFSLIALFINSYYTKKLFSYGFFKQLSDLKPIIISTLLIAFIVFLPLFLPFNLFYICMIQILAFASSFILFNMLINRKIVSEILLNFKNIRY